VRYLGDTLLLRPPIVAVKAAFPDARVGAVVTAGTACALADLSALDEVIEWTPRGGLRAWNRLLCGNWDWAVDFTGNDRSALVALASRARFRVAYDRPKLPRWSLKRCAYSFRVRHRKYKPHTLLQRLELLEACGVPAAGLDFALAPRPDALLAVARRLEGIPRPMVLVHPTSRDMKKALPVAAVRAVISELLAQGRGVVVTSGPSPVERAHATACSRDFSCGLVVLSDLDWHELVAAIWTCGVFWGSDTAPAHIASALAKPSRVEFGPSRADHWHPLHAEGTWAVHECACLKRPSCPNGGPGLCLQNIDCGEVAKWILSTMGAV